MDKEDHESLVVDWETLINHGHVKQSGQQKWKIKTAALQGDWRNTIRPNEERTF